MSEKEIKTNNDELMTEEEETTLNKNKTWAFVSIAIAIILIAITAGTIFCIKTCNITPAPSEFTMVGSWKMYKRAENFENDDTTVKYLEFSEKVVKVYNGNDTTPTIESKYTLNLVENELKFTDINLRYQVLGRFANCYVAIAENEFTEFVLVRCNDKALNGNYTNIKGEWQAVIHDKKEVNQKVIIEDGNIKIYQENETTPSVNVGYDITNDGIIEFQLPYASYMSRYEIAYLSENNVTLVELGGTGKHGASVFILKK